MMIVHLMNLNARFILIYVKSHVTSDILCVTGVLNPLLSTLNPIELPPTTWVIIHRHHSSPNTAHIGNPLLFVLDLPSDT